MAERLNGVRRLLYDTLLRLNVRGEWRHVIEQRGMFSYTGISAPTVARLKSEYHIYMLGNGRISLAGLNAGNCDRFVSALADILGHNE
jgi:aspartate aminotransferase